MAQAIDEHLDRMAWLDEVDRRNSCYRRHQLSELGDIELAVLRNPAICANWCGTPMLAPEQVDRMIMACFVLGLSAQGRRGIGANPRAAHQPRHRQHGGQAARCDVGRLSCAATQGSIHVLMLDGVVLARKTGAGAIQRPVPVAFALRNDGKKEVIDFRLARARAPPNGSVSLAT